VLTAAAMRCLNGEIQGGWSSPGPRTRTGSARWESPTSTGCTAPRIWRPGRSIIFAAAGVTDGALLKAVRFFPRRHPDGVSGHDDTAPPVRFIDTIHAEDRPDIVIRF